MNTIQKWIAIFILVLLVAGWITAYVFIRKYQDQTTTNSNNASIIKTATKLVKNSIDTFNNTHSHREEQAPITHKQLETEKLPGWADTAARSLDQGANYKQQLEEQTRVNIELKDSLVAAKHRLNEAKRDVFFYKNKYINLQYTSGNPVDTADKGTFAYRYNLSPVITQYSDRKWFLGPRHYYIDITSPDTNAHFTDVQHYRVREPEPFFSVRVGAGGKYNFNNKLLEPGARIRFDVGHVSVFGSLFYNYDLRPTTPWVFSAGAFYDFIRF